MPITGSSGAEKAYTRKRPWAWPNRTLRAIAVSRGRSAPQGVLREDRPLPLLIEPNRPAARWKRKCKPLTPQHFSLYIPGFTCFRLLECVPGSWAHAVRIDGKLLLRAGRQTDALEEPAAGLRAVKLPGDPFVGAAVERRVRVVIAIQHQVGRSAPDGDQLPGQGKVVIVPADVQRRKQHGRHAAVE